MLVSQIFKSKGDRIVTALASNSVAQAAEILQRENIGAIMVVQDGGGLAGILSERDIVRAMPAHGPGLFQLSVESLMTKDVVTCGSSDQVHDLMKKMTAGRFRHMPVMDGDKIVGIISIGDVVKSRLQQLETETSELRDYIVGAG